ncbi:hypothetical protein [Cyclobacterium plantarum]|uniref:hypothetical protein n=1 Tax=Cyclobacterium plantarum TaxID=2716263 RepID=UPI003F71726E
MTKLTLGLVDSIMVDELSPLVIDDYLESTGHFLMRGTRSRKPYLVNDKGFVLMEYDILNESPNGVGSNGALGYGFLDQDRWVAQGIFNGYHIFDMKGKKVKLLEPIQLDIYAMSIYSYRTFFRSFTKSGKGIIIGQEQNLFDPKTIEKDKIQTPEYYEKVKTVFAYAVENGQLDLLETYPVEWTPRKMGDFVGQSQPIVAYHRHLHEMAILPAIGNQLFIYDFSKANPELKKVVELSHRFLPEGLPERGQEVEGYSDYPNFTDVRYVGERLLVEFKTKIPVDLITQLRSKSEQYYNLPEFKEALKAFAKPYYMVVDNGEQIGALDGLPVHGALDFADENGFIYVNDNLEPEVEREYNIFYKLKFNELD